MVTFKNKKQEVILVEVVRGCLKSPSDDQLAEWLCQCLLDAIAQRTVHAMDYGNLVTALGAIFPRVVLDVLVERTTAAMDDRRNMFASYRERSPCPLSKINDDVLLAWACERPESRFLQLAEAIRPWRSAGTASSNDNAADGEPGVLQWTDAALRILHEAPDPLEILSEYTDRFRPSGWSGSLADILESRLPLLEHLTEDHNLSIAGAAKAAIAQLKDDVTRTREWEASFDRKRDERFEW